MLQSVQNRNVNRAPSMTYREVFWPITVTFLLLLTSIVVPIAIYYRSSLDILAPFIHGEAPLVQALTPTNIWQILATILLATVIVLAVFFSVYDRGDGFRATLGKTLVFFIIAAILTGTVYNSVVTTSMSLSQLLQFFGPTGSTGGVITAIILCSLVLIFIPARYTAREQRPSEQPGYPFVGCASAILLIGLLAALIGALIHITAIYQLVIDHIVMPLVATAQSMNMWWKILSTVLSIILLVIANFRIVFASVRGKARQEGDGSGPALRRTLVVLTIEAILLTMLYRAVHVVLPLQHILTQWRIGDQEILGILLSITILLVMNVYAFTNIREPEKGRSDFWVSVMILLLFLVVDAVSLGIIYGVLHGFVLLVTSWSGALPILVAVTSVLLNITIIVDKDQYLTYLFVFALLLLGAAYLLGTAFVVFTPGLLGLTYFAGSWWIALLIASPALITIVIFLLRPSKP